MVSVGILAIVIVGLLQLYVQCSSLSELAGNTTLAVSETQSKMEEIRNYDYSSIETDYGSGGTPGDTFTLNGLNGSGAITTTRFGGSGSLLQVQIDTTWTNRNGRVSNITLVSMIAER